MRFLYTTLITIGIVLLFLPLVSLTAAAIYYCALAIAFTGWLVYGSFWATF